MCYFDVDGSLGDCCVSFITLPSICFTCFPSTTRVSRVYSLICVCTQLSHTYCWYFHREDESESKMGGEQRGSVVLVASIH